ncbi:MAG: DUF3352 domain-containing protein [Planctomycetota bacterium]|jgi:hypothetical protein
MRGFLKQLFIVQALCTFFCSVAAGAVPETGKLVPTETIVLINMNNFSKSKANFEKTDIYGLYKDPAMKAFVEDAKEKLLQKAREKKSNILQTLMENEITPEGRVFFALVLSEKAKADKEPQALFFVQLGSSIEKAKEVITDIVRKAIDEGARQSEEDYRGVALKTIIKEDGRFDYGFSSAMSYCFIDDYLVASEDIETLRFCIAHIQGASGSSLAQDSEYSSAMGAIGQDHDLVFYINLKHIIETQIAQDETDQTKTTILNLGLDNLACICGFVNMASSPENSWLGRVLLRVNGEKKGILKMLELENSTFLAPRFIPSSMSSVSFVNIDIQKAYQELANVLTAFSPQQAALLYMPLIPPSPEGEPGFELKKDFIDYLGSQIVYTSGIDKKDEEELKPESLFAVRVSNAQALEKSLSSLHWRIIGVNKPDSKREILGHTIYSLGYSFFPYPVPEQQTMQSPVDSEQPVFPPLAFTIADTHLIFGQEQVVERAIRTLSSSEDISIRATQWFKKAQSALPTAAGLVGMEDASSTGEVLWRMFKKTREPQDSESSVEFGVGIDSAAGLFPGMQFSQRLFDMSLLPEFDVVQKYFGLYVDYLVRQPDGFMFEFKSLKSAESD